MIFARDPLADPAPLIKRVYAYVAYRIGNGVDAEDITSETFERALRYKATYDRSKGDPAAWLIGIARRLIAEHATARAAEGGVELPETVSARGDVEGETIRQLSIRRAMAALNDRQRELIALRYGADLAAREIARILDIKPNAVDVALHRARARLEAELRAGGEGESTKIEVEPVRN